MTINENVTPRALHRPAELEPLHLGEMLAKIGHISIKGCRYIGDLWSGNKTIGLNAAIGNLSNVPPHSEATPQANDD